MLILSVVGIIIILVGLGLFAYDQIKVRQGQTSQLSAWKINLSGPPALVLVILGIAVFMFPHTSFFGIPSEPEVPVTGTTPTETTQEGTTSTTIVEDTSVETTVEEILFPDAPYDYQIFFEETPCEGDVIEWFQADPVAGWYIIIEVYSITTDEFIDAIEIDTNDDSRLYEGRSALCYWEFHYADDVYYYMYIYAYSDSEYSEEALAIEYALNSGQG